MNRLIRNRGVADESGPHAPSASRQGGLKTRDAPSASSPRPPREDPGVAPDASPTAWPNERLLRVRDVSELLALSPRTVWRMASTGELPAPIRLGGSTRWRWGDLRALVCER